MKFGTVAIIGRSNVGKSTLLNRLLNEKIAIVSEKPQTTRTRILGVVHAPGAQIAFLDTPGLHKPQHLLNRRMVRTAVETLVEADLLFVLMDATTLPGPGDLMALDHVRMYFALGTWYAEPTNLATTTPLLFFTRWITHFCAPVFVFLAGTSAYLYGMKVQSSKETA